MTQEVGHLIRTPLLDGRDLILFQGQEMGIDLQLNDVCQLFDMSTLKCAFGILFLLDHEDIIGLREKSELPWTCFDLFEGWVLPLRSKSLIWLICLPRHNLDLLMHWLRQNHVLCDLIQSPLV